MVSSFWSLGVLSKIILFLSVEKDGLHGEEDYH